MDSNTDAYTRIRWKTPLEKINHARTTSIRLTELELDKNNNKNNIVVMQFLESECIKTSFDTDFIVVYELRDRYRRFCIDKKIDDLMMINIVGCKEMKAFGAELNRDMLLPFMSGIAFTRTINFEDDKFIPNIVRIPKNSKHRKAESSTFSKILNWIFALLFDRKGIITNLIIVLLHLIMIFVVPYLILALTVWSLQQINLIQQNIYDRVYTINDMIYPSYYDFWFNDLAAKPIIWIVVGLSAFYIIFGLIELTSYYATGARDNGKYIVERSICKRISVFSFWLMIIVFLVVYTAYTSVMLGWWILGAIITPEKFLPFATTAAVIFIFVTSMYTRLKKLHKGLKEAVSETVTEQIRVTLLEGVNKNKGQIEKAKEFSSKVTSKVFGKTMNKFLNDHGYSQVSKEMIDVIFTGDMSALLDLMNENCGIDKSIGLALIGCVKQDNLIILDSIDKLSKRLKINAEFATTICEIILDRYDPDRSGINKVNGKIVLLIK